MSCNELRGTSGDPLRKFFLPSDRVTFWYHVRDHSIHSSRTRFASALHFRGSASCYELGMRATVLILSIMQLSLSGCGSSREERGARAPTEIESPPRQPEVSPAPDARMSIVGGRFSVALPNGSTGVDASDGCEIESTCGFSMQYSDAELWLNVSVISEEEITPDEAFASSTFLPQSLGASARAIPGSDGNLRVTRTDHVNDGGQADGAVVRDIVVFEHNAFVTRFVARASWINENATGSDLAARANAWLDATFRTIRLTRAHVRGAPVRFPNPRDGATEFEITLPDGFYASSVWWGHGYSVTVVPTRAFGALQTCEELTVSTSAGSYFERGAPPCRSASALGMRWNFCRNTQELVPGCSFRTAMFEAPSDAPNWAQLSINVVERTGSEGRMLPLLSSGRVVPSLEPAEANGENGEKMGT